MRTAALLLVLLTACGRHAQPGAPPNVPHTVAVLPPNNRTGDPLLVTGASFLERYATHGPRLTVADVLAGESRAQLERRGFDVVPDDKVDDAVHGRTPGSAEAAAEIARHGDLHGAVLYLEVRRWDPDAPTHPAFVVVGLDAAIVDVDSGKVLWSLGRAAQPVATPGEVTLGAAYATAARKVMNEILASLGPERDRPRRERKRR